MQIYEQSTTLIAAGLAAGASLVTLVMQFVEQRRAEMRAAFRTGRHPYLADLGDAIHSTLACSIVLLKANKSEEAYRKWREKGQEAQGRLKQIRIAVRYQLWGLDEGMNTLTRIPDWIDHARKVTKRATRLALMACKLGDTLDRGIRASYYSGTTPWLRHRVASALMYRVCAWYFNRGRDTKENEAE